MAPQSAWPSGFEYFALKFWVYTPLITASPVKLTGLRPLHTSQNLKKKKKYFLSLQTSLMTGISGAHLSRMCATGSSSLIEIYNRSIYYSDRFQIERNSLNKIFSRFWENWRLFNFKWFFRLFFIAFTKSSILQPPNTPGDAKVDYSGQANQRAFDLQPETVWSNFEPLLHAVDKICLGDLRPSHGSLQV